MCKNHVISLTLQTNGVLKGEKGGIAIALLGF